jgi:hypothetical protein
VPLVVKSERSCDPLVAQHERPVYDVDHGQDPSLPGLKEERVYFGSFLFDPSGANFQSVFAV